MIFKPGDPVWVMVSPGDAPPALALPCGTHPAVVLRADAQRIGYYEIDCPAFPPPPDLQGMIARYTVRRHMLRPRRDGDDSNLPARWEDIPHFKPNRMGCPTQPAPAREREPILAPLQARMDWALARVGL